MALLSRLKICGKIYHNTVHETHSLQWHVVTQLQLAVLHHNWGWCWLWPQQICLYMLYLSHRSWATGIPRAFDVRYNAYTQSIEVLQHKDQVLNLVKDIRGKCIRLTPWCNTVSYLPPYHATVTTLGTTVFSICFSGVFLWCALNWYLSVK